MPWYEVVGIVAGGILGFLWLFVILLAMAVVTVDLWKTRS